AGMAVGPKHRRSDNRLSMTAPGLRMPAIIAGSHPPALRHGPGRFTEAFMARIPIEMPRMGYDMETGTIAAWTKQVGDTVARGDVLAEIETEQSTVAMGALERGTSHRR